MAWIEWIEKWNQKVERNFNNHFLCVGTFFWSKFDIQWTFILFRLWFMTKLASHIVLWHWRQFHFFRSAPHNLKHTMTLLIQTILNREKKNAFQTNAIYLVHIVYRFQRWITSNVFLFCPILDALFFSTFKYFDVIFVYQMKRRKKKMLSTEKSLVISSWTGHTTMFDFFFSLFVFDSRCRREWRACAHTRWFFFAFVSIRFRY